MGDVDDLDDTATLIDGATVIDTPAVNGTASQQQDDDDNGYMPEFLIHRSHKIDGEDSEKRSGLRFVDSAQRDHWTVKLRFLQGGRVCHGTGFFVNIPTNTLKPKWDVIFTAGHNLISKTGAKSESMTVLQTDPNGMPVADMPAPEFRICPEYERNPARASPVHDYGIVMLPWRNGRDGFAFDLSLAYADKLGGVGEARVTGYRENDDAGYPRTSSGGYRLYSNLVMYDAKTEQGMSGSPVWVAHDDQETVIGIHNNGPAAGRSGSRGSRINLAVMQNIFGWIGLQGSSLFPGMGVKALTRNLYLHFNAYSDEAMVRCATDAETCVFDIFPVKSTAGRLKNNDPTSALMLRRPDDWDDNGDEEKVWVRWNVDEHEVTLADALRPSSFVRVKRVKTGVFKLLKMHVGPSGEELVEYRMGGGELEEGGAVEESGETEFGIQDGRLTADQFAKFEFVAVPGRP